MINLICWTVWINFKYKATSTTPDLLISNNLLYLFYNLFKIKEPTAGSRRASLITSTWFRHTEWVLSRISKKKRKPYST